MNLATSRIGKLRIIVKLNYYKSKEIIFRARGVRGKSVQLPSPCQSIERLRELINWLFSTWSSTIVWLLSTMLATCCRHVPVYCTCCVANVAESRHSRSVAGGHFPSDCDGEDTTLCSSMVRLLFISRPSETWCVLTKMQEIRLLWTERAYNGWTFTDADDTYFLRILSNKNHVLQTFLSERQAPAYSLRVMTHN